MKKSYEVIDDVTAEDMSEEATNNTAGGGTAVELPLVKVDGINEGIIDGFFTLPDVKEYEESTIQVAHRVLGFPMTAELLNHMPSNVTASHLGKLAPMVPFAYHKRFGDTWTNRICPESLRTDKCRACTGRKTLFSCDDYKSGKIPKDAILKDGGFGTKLAALMISRTFVNDEDLGIQAHVMARTNPKAPGAVKDNFFDLVKAAKTKKKLMVGEVLPFDYFGDGDGARWIIADYTRTLFHPDAKVGDAPQKGKGHPYWKLTSISVMKEIDGVGKAKDIWWPQDEDVDTSEVIDIYALFNMTDNAELDAIAIKAEEKVMRLAVKPKGGAKGEKAPARAPQEGYELPSWTELITMNVDELLVVGEALGGDMEPLVLVGKVNPLALRKAIATLGGIKPTMVKKNAAVETTEEDDIGRKDIDDADVIDEDDLPF